MYAYNIQVAHVPRLTQNGNTRSASATHAKLVMHMSKRDERFVIIIIITNTNGP